MITKQSSPRTYLLLLLIFGVAVQVLGQRGDASSLDYDNPALQESCTCSGSIATSVIITTVVLVILATLSWCYVSHKNKKNAVTPDAEAASRAAYDNPHFQGDDLDTTDGNNQVRVNVQASNSQQGVKLAPTNASNTLERGKSTLERVINAVVRGNKLGFEKKSKDDYHLGTKQYVTVPLQGHDFTGLGFTIHGNMTEGLFVKEVMSRGPASQSGQIVPGDRVVAITVLTDHMVYEDAITILSSASPYPVIVNVEKGSGPISGFSTLNSKTKLNTSSVALIHPSFKTQSCADFKKIKTVDLSRLKLGNIVPIVPKGKVLTTSNNPDVTKLQKASYVQRSSSDRHSERAIDVPGVDVRSKSSEIKLNIDNLGAEDKTELANVQVHRPMSPSIDANVDYTTIDIPKFGDSKLTDVSENSEATVDKNQKGPKFGVKVFPDMSFLKKTKSIDMETGELELNAPQIPDTNVNLSYEKETKMAEPKESSINYEINQSECDIKFKRKVSPFAPECDLNDPFEDNLSLKDIKKNVNIETNAEIPLSSMNIEEENINKSSNNNFKIEMPDINFPSFGTKGDSKEEENNSDKEEKSLSKSFKFGLPSFNIDSKDSKSDPSKEKISAVENNPQETGQMKSEYEMKTQVIDLNMPSIDIDKKNVTSDTKISLSSRDNIDINVTTDSQLPKITKTSDSKESDSNDSEAENSKMTTKKGFSIHAPDLTLPSLKLKSKKSTDANNENDKKPVKKKSSTTKTGFKIEAPDINLPTFNLKKRKSKDYSGEDVVSSPEPTETEVNSDTEIIGAKSSLDVQGSNFNVDIDKNETNKDTDDEKKPKKEKKKSKDKSGFNFKFKGPDFSFPNFGAKSSIKDSKSDDDVVTPDINAKCEIPEPKINFEMCKENKTLTENVSNFSNPELDASLPGFEKRSSNLECQTKSEFSIPVNGPKIEESYDISNIDKTKVPDISDLKETPTSMQSVEIPDINVDIRKDIDIENFLDTDVVTTLGNECVAASIDSKFDGTMSSIPSEYELKSNVKAAKLCIDKPVPDEIKVKSNMLESLESSDLNFKDVKIPQIASPDLGFEDDKSKNDNNERGGNSDNEMSIKLPELSQVKWSVKSNSSYDDSSTSKNVSLDSNLPDIDTDLIDDESSEDLNITDATKKKRFGYKIQTQDLVLPSFSKSPLDIKKEDKDLIDKNQSDEMKSFNLKLKDPSLPEGAIAITTEPETDYNDIDDIRVKLPRVKVSNLKSKISESENEIVAKPFKLNKSDEWKIKGVNIDGSSGSRNLNFTGSNETPEDERDNKFNIDDADFVIPDIKSIPGYDINNFPDFDILSHGFEAKKNENSAVALDCKLTEFDIKQRRKIFEDAEKNFKENSEEEQITKKDYLPDFQIDIAKSKFLNLSLESSELESDLPEADSDLKKPSTNFSIKDINLETERLDADLSPNYFGNAFGFRGFKKHIARDELQERELYSSVSYDEISSAENASNSLNLDMDPIVQSDLPEVDIDIDSKCKGEFKEINPKYKSEIKDINIEKQIDINLQSKKVNLSNPELSVDASGFGSKFSESIVKSGEHSIDASKAGDEDERSKSKSKIGLGFGLKNFSKSSESDDNQTSNKVTNELECTSSDVKDKNRVKAKKTFSFKGLVGRSSSDTEEENERKVSENPMNDEHEEKVKLRNKSSLTFGFNRRSSKNSDSEDNCDSEKVENNPHIEGISKKHKTKSNISFGFINKTKVGEPDVFNPPEVTVSSKVISTKENKYENKSESEGGEDEKLSKDARVDESRGKSKYGLNFGFRKGNDKRSSDSEGIDNDETQINLDERGTSDKNKEHKGKSLKLGFKGFKNLKGKIQNEFNKMRHDSPSTDEDDKSDEFLHGEKRKKLPKKKDKDKKFKRETEEFMDPSEEAALTSAGQAAKDSRRKRISSKSSSSSSSSDSSDDDEVKVVEMKKKKKTKSKRKEEGRVSTTSSEIKISTKDIDSPVKEINSEGVIDYEYSQSVTSSSEKSNVTVIESALGTKAMESDVSLMQNIDVTSNPRRYVVVREMKLKKTPAAHDKEEPSVKISRDNIAHQPNFSEDRANFTTSGTDTDGANWGSDSDMDKVADGINSSDASVNLVINKKHKHLTDSEELKRKATSLGDLSRLHEGSGVGTLLERAVSLDLKNASVGHPSLHIRRLQLPDSSATSIDEADEPLSSSSPKKLDSNFGLKAASQWGTLEEALRLGIRSNEHISTTTESAATTFVRTMSVEEGAPVSNIEISGDPSVTTLSVAKHSWNESFEDECPPSLPSSPVPIAPTTITVKEKLVSNIQETVTTDSSIVVIGSEEIERMNNIHNVNVADEATGDDSSVVTITMVPAESHINVVSPPVPNLKHSMDTSELIGYNNIQDAASIVTVSHDRMYENGEFVSDSSDHNISDEFITPDATPKKSMTQITLEGDGGYTVTEGTISRTVILTSPEVESSVIVRTDGREASIS